MLLNIAQSGRLLLRGYRHPWLPGWLTQCEYITANEVLVQLLSWRAWSVFFNGVCGEIGVAYDQFATVWRSIGMDYRTGLEDADELTEHAIRVRRHRTRLQSENESAGLCWRPLSTERQGG